jgi:succinate-semialdehyde dehydrogenase/glutarate-semialdehyde dehydrogenase
MSPSRHEEARAAVSAASAALPEWSARTPTERSNLLRRWFDLIVEHKQDLAVVLTSEQGKPLAEALAEIDYAASFIEFYAEEAKRICGETFPSHRKDARIVTIRQALGVVAAITPWNFPAVMITRKLGLVAPIHRF